MNNSQRPGGGGGIIGIIVLIVVAVGGLIASYKLIPALFKVLIWVVIGVVILVIALIVLLVILANKSGKDRDERTAVGGASDKLDDSQNEIIANARKELMDLRRVVLRIRQVPIRTAANGVCGQLDKILQTLREKPEKINDSRQCLNYYIPTLRDVLSHFEDLDKKGQMTETITEKTKSFLADVDTALQKQYSNLFESDKLDMEVDMEAMKIAIKRDGLL